MTAREKAIECCKALDEKKGKDIILINVSGKTDICDYFVIASAQSATQVKALCDNLEEKLEKQGVFARSKEGYGEGRWICVDLGDVVVHIFKDDTRLFYHLERLWTSGDNIERYPPETEAAANS